MAPVAWELAALAGVAWLEGGAPQGAEEARRGVYSLERCARDKDGGMVVMGRLGVEEMVRRKVRHGKLCVCKRRSELGVRMSLLGYLSYHK